MPDADVRIVAYEPDVSSVRAARGLVQASASDWGLDDLSEDCSLCVSELVANAVLHSRRTFTLVLRRTLDGLRIEVIDRRPDLLPYLTPTGGSAADLTAIGATGRGLLLVAAIASRWGASTTAASKDVWVEITHGTAHAVTPPVLSLGYQEPLGRDFVALTFLELPVRASVASVIQTEEILREAQLDTAFEALLNEDGSNVMEMVDRTAAMRLSIRHGALLAAADNVERFDLALSAPNEALNAMASLRRLLARFSARSTHRAAIETPAVGALRSWLDGEVERQRGGQSPSRCPLAI